MHYLTLTLGPRSYELLPFLYLLHHETYALRTFEGVMSNGLGGDAFIREIHHLTFDLDLGAKVI